MTSATTTVRESFSRLGRKRKGRRRADVGREERQMQIETAGGNDHREKGERERRRSAKTRPLSLPLSLFLSQERQASEKGRSRRCSRSRRRDAARRTIAASLARPEAKEREREQKRAPAAAEGCAQEAEKGCKRAERLRRRGMGVWGSDACKGECGEGESKIN